MKYTAGELFYTEEGQYDFVIRKREKLGRYQPLIARFVNKDDALLFLAAPEMYEALLEWLNGNDEAKAFRMARQAMAKAEGTK